MKSVYILVLVIFGQLAFAQNSAVTIALDTFTEVKVFDGLAVNLIKSADNRIEVTGENNDKVAVVINEGVLKVRMQIGKIFSGYKTFVTLYYAQPLVVIDVNEDARITSAKQIKQEVLELKAQEGGEITVDAVVEQMLIKCVSGGVINTRGQTNVQDVQINTGGVYAGKELKSQLSTINVNAGSRAEVYASKYVKATVKAGGEVFVYGNPESLEEKTIFGGSIKRMQ